MISAARLAANRQNARASTGPRSEAGKAKSARNARRHGLAGPIESDPAFSGRIPHYAAILAEGRPVEEVWPLAQAYVEVERVRQTKLALLKGLAAVLEEAAADLPPALGRTFVFGRALKPLRSLERYERAAYRRLFREMRAWVA